MVLAREILGVPTQYALRAIIDLAQKSMIVVLQAQCVIEVFVQCHVPLADVFYGRRELDTFYHHRRMVGSKAGILESIFHRESGLSISHHLRFTDFVWPIPMRLLSG